MPDYPNFAGKALFKDVTEPASPDSGNLAVYSESGVLKTKTSAGVISSMANMVGATSSVAGTAGLVPAPAAGDNDRFLAGDATFGIAPRIVSPCLPDWLTGTHSRSAEGCPYVSLGGYGYAVGANRLGLCPVFIRQGITYTKIGARIGNDAARTATKIRVGIYNVSSTNLKPTTLIVESGEFTYTNNATVEATISQYIKSGFYWMAFVTDGSHLLNGGTGLGTNQFQNSFIVGIRTTNSQGGAPSVSQPYISHTYGALPSDVTSSTIAFNNDNSFPHLFIY
jgi:hypothetical protein